MDVRGFLEQFTESNIGGDPLPIKVLRNAIAFDDIPGQAMFWAFEYLDQRSCPSHYIYRILQKLFEEIPKTDFESCVDNDVPMGESAETGVRYEPLKLMRAVVKKIDEICVREREDLEDSVDGTIETPDMLPNVHAISYHNIKNTRRYMEDRITMLPRMDRIYGLSEPISYFAVFDGHNGAEAAEFCAAQLHNHLIQSMRQHQSPIESISDAFESLDENFINKCRACKLKSGSTAVLVLIMAGKLYVAWVGDSQAVLAKQSEINNLVIPHKPERADEVERIRSLGGDVLNLNGTCRVNGNLAVSRAIGDADDKKFIISTPDIKMLELDGSEEFLILGCDGIWDEVSPEGAVQIVRRQIVSDPENVQGISRRLVQQAKMKGSSDNISVIVVTMEPIETIRSRYEGILESEPETDFGTLKPTLDTVLLPPTDGSTDFESHVPSIIGMNGHNQEASNFADILNLNEAGGIETGGEVLADDIDGWDKLKRSDDDVDEDKDVEELSDAEPDDEWQFEKPMESNPPQLILEPGALSNEDVNNTIQLVEGLDLQDTVTTDAEPLLINPVEESQKALVDDLEPTATQFNGLSLTSPTSGHLEEEIITLVADRQLEPSTESLNPFVNEIKLEETNFGGVKGSIHDINYSNSSDSTQAHTESSEDMLGIGSSVFEVAKDQEPRLENVGLSPVVSDNSFELLNPFNTIITRTSDGRIEETVVLGSEISLENPETVVEEGACIDLAMDTTPQVNPFDMNEVTTDTPNQLSNEMLGSPFHQEVNSQADVEDIVKPDVLSEEPTDNVPSHEENANYESRDILVDIAASTNPFAEEPLVPASDNTIAKEIQIEEDADAGLPMGDSKVEQSDIETIHMSSFSNTQSESEIQEADFVQPIGNPSNDEEAQIHDAGGSLDIPHDVSTPVQPVTIEQETERADSVEMLLPPRDLGAAPVSPDMSRELFGDVEIIDMGYVYGDSGDAVNAPISSVTTRSEIMDLPSSVVNAVTSTTEEGSILFDLKLSDSKEPENSELVENVAETTQVNIETPVDVCLTEDTNGAQSTKPFEAGKSDEEDELIITEVYDKPAKEEIQPKVVDANNAEAIYDIGFKPPVEELPVLNGKDSPCENAAINNKDVSESSDSNANIVSLGQKMEEDPVPVSVEPEIIEVIQEAKVTVDNKAVPKGKTSSKEVAAPKSRASLTSAAGAKKSPSKTADPQAKSPSANSRPIAPKASPSKPAVTGPKAPATKGPSTTTSSTKPLVGRVAPVASATTRSAPSRIKDAEPKLASKSSTTTGAATKSATARPLPAPLTKPALPKAATTSPKRVPTTTAAKPSSSARTLASGVGVKVGEEAKAAASTLAKPRPKPMTGVAPRPATKVEARPLGAEAKKPAGTGSVTKVGGIGATKPAAKPLVSRSAPTSSRTVPPSKMAPTKPLSSRPAPKADDKAITKPVPKLTTTAKVPSVPKKIESTLKSKKPAPTAISKGGMQSGKIMKTKSPEKSVEMLEQNGVSNGSAEAAEPPMNVSNGVNGHHLETENGEVHPENGVHDGVDLLTEQN